MKKFTFAVFLFVSVPVLGADEITDPVSEGTVPLLTISDFKDASNVVAVPSNIEVSVYDDRTSTVLKAKESVTPAATVYVALDEDSTKIVRKPPGGTEKHNVLISFTYTSSAGEFTVNRLISFSVEDIAYLPYPTPTP